MKAPGAFKALDRGADTSAAYGTGTVIHADALRTGDTALAALDVAFSGAAYSSAADGEAITNEVHRLVSEKLAANAGFGRGTGLELGIASDPIPLIGQLSKAAAPPSTDLVHKVIGPLGIPNVLTAELLRSQAQARAADGCVLGRDQAYGLGSVLDLEVLGGFISTVARPPRREVSQSSSTSRIVPGSEPGRLGLKSETRQTIAPVTLFKGTPIQFTVEVLGEWALRAVADGAKGSVHYGPLKTSPETPVARVLNAQGKVLGQLTTQDLLGDDGLEIVIPGVAEIVIGEDPRAINGDASSKPAVSGTAIAAAADVVRIKLIGGTLADIRVGHMEAAVNVPAGGVNCPGLDVDQDVDPPAVTPGDDFTYSIEITNPHDCVLEDMKLVVTLTGTDGVKFTIDSVEPSGADIAGGVITWNNLGTLDSGATKTVKVKVTIPADSKNGKLTSKAVVTGVCPDQQQPSTDVDGPNVPSDPPGDIPVRGEDTLEGPTVGTCTVPSLVGDAKADAIAELIAAGCKLGNETTQDSTNPDQVGKIVEQSTPPGTEVPIGTPVDITVAGPVRTSDVADTPTTCNVPNLAGLTEAQAKEKLEAAGCKLGDVKPGADNQDQAGKITEQSVPSGQSVPKGTEVDITVAGPVGTDLGTQVLGETATKSDAGAAPALARTGGVAMAGIALWLLFSGLLTSGSAQAWKVLRRKA